MKLRLLKAGDPRLRAISTPVPHITPQILAFGEALIQGMFDFNGVGLAAPQVGKNIRMAAVRFNTETPAKEDPFVIINPVISGLSVATVEGEEGCLSLPGLFGPLARARELTLNYMDLEGKQQVRQVRGFDARIVQHEVDHLDGFLYVDRVADKTQIRLAS